MSTHLRLSYVQMLGNCIYCMDIYTFILVVFFAHDPMCVYIYIYIYISTYINVHIHIYIWMHIYVMHSISFQTFFVQAFKIVRDSWKVSMLLLYILWDDWPIFMISGSNEQLQQQLEYTLLKPDCHSWCISKMQFGHEDTLEEWYAIKFCFILGKNATETYGMLQAAFRQSYMNRALVFGWHKRFKERQGFCEGWWEVCEEWGSQYTRVDWPKG